MQNTNRPVALVTGGSRGIGAAIAKLLGANGYNVAVNYAKDGAAAQKVLDQLVALGSRAVGIQADISREADVLRLFEIADRELGPPRALVNNAAITGGVARVENIDSAALAQMLAVNVDGTMLCAREAVRRMSTKRGGAGGAIVNISSIAARTGSAGEWVHYAASKGAVNTFTLGLAREVATEGIRVNAVAPGLGGYGAARGEWRTRAPVAAHPHDTDAASGNTGGDRAERAMAALRRGFLCDGDDSRNRRRAMTESPRPV